ncbi:MAG: TetR/AcrR family transcriptional regulator [Gammaproteobacteria bacterium]|nr:TetR/AcrR family transcriptional regulator [Gammaproteobacteria bacterium]
MGQKGDALRQRIIAAADQLFYEQGYENTSFSDIANAVNISRGNFYFYFKSKNDILSAVLSARLDDVRAMLEEWETLYPAPKLRIIHYIDILTTNQSNVTKHGCPIGSLCTELVKLSHDMQSQATSIFALFCHWLTAQFFQLGQKRNARRLAMHLLARGQGIASIANAFNDAKFLQREVKSLKIWLDEVTQD